LKYGEHSVGAPLNLIVRAQLNNMRRLLSMFAAYLIGVGTCGAQSNLCSNPPSDFVTAPVINFSPAAPNASQLVTISVGMNHYEPHGATASVDGNVINVMLDASYILTPTAPPRDCRTTVIGPLPTGTYTVNLFVILALPPSTTPTLVLSRALVITPALSSVPTATSISVVALALLLSAVAWCVLPRSYS
jgi:hypothetical protein